MSTITSTPYDDVFRTLLNDCTKLIIPVINEIFDENYSGDEPITESKNEHFIHITDTSTKEKITDSCFTIHGTVDKSYHIECQSTPDGSMVVRMFEYDAQVALYHGVVEQHILTLSFPHSAVLYLRHNSKTPDYMTVKITTPGTDAEYQIPIIKIQTYTISQIFEKNLLFLIPFHIFCYENDFPVYNTNEEKLKELMHEFSRIRSKLELLCRQEKITEYEKRSIINLSEKVIENISKSYQAVKEGVTSIMGGQILDYEAKDILHKGIQQGIQQGELQTYINLVKDGLLTINEAAKRLNMDESKFQKYL